MLSFHLSIQSNFEHLFNTTPSKKTASPKIVGEWVLPLVMGLSIASCCPPDLILLCADKKEMHYSSEMNGWASLRLSLKHTACCLFSLKRHIKVPIEQKNQTRLITCNEMTDNTMSRGISVSIVFFFIFYY